MPPDRGPAWAKLRELRAAVDSARGRLGELAQAERKARRSLDAARQPLVAYLEAAEAGQRELDPAEIERLSAPIREAALTLELRPALRGRPEGGSDIVGLEAVDPQAEARVRGARTALDERERELAPFKREHFPQLVAEVAPEALAASQYRHDLAASLATAEERLRRIDAELTGLCRETGRASVDDVTSLLLTNSAAHEVDVIARTDPREATPALRGLLEAAAS
jgi:hypothetical protein